VDFAHAPAPTNRSERLIFGQLYEPLVRADCSGALRPALASEWTSGDGGASWTLVLRADAWFADGSPLTAADVVQSLRGHPALTAIAALGDRRVLVTLATPNPSGPIPLASLALAVTRPGPESRPLGTGPYRLDARAGLLTGASPLLRLRPAPAADLRDLVDADVGLIVTDEPAVVSYARSRPDRIVVPLPWDRAYGLLAPAGSPAAAPLDSAERAALARDAVRADARPSAERCAGGNDDGNGGDGARPAAGVDIAYPSGDPVARDLAARLLALGRAGRGGRAVALDPAALRRDAEAGRDAVLVAASPPETLCPAPGAAGRAIVPLIETRATVILRRNAAPPVVDADGTLRWLPPGEGGAP
jgi:hypothetical protein